MNITRHSIQSTFLALAISALAVSQGLAQMNYQGRLTDSSGNNLPPGQYTIEFRLFDEAGVEKWGPYTTDGTAGNGHGPRVDLVDGRFNTVIGNLDAGGDALSTAFNGSEKRFLQIKVGNNPAITPRQLLLPAPIALYAQKANQADTAANFTSVVLKTDETNARVGIGTATPAARLHVRGVGNAWPASTGTAQSGHVARFQGGSGSGAVLDLGSNFGNGFWLQSTDEGDLEAKYPLLLNPNGGNVGINTTAPTVPLNVVGTNDASLANGSGVLVIGPEGGYNIVMDQNEIQGRNAGSASGLYLNADGGDTLINAFGNGNVGIGTSTPNSRLQVMDPGAATGIIQVGASSSSLGVKRVRFGDGDYVYVGESGTSDDTLELKGSKIAMIGNVGIGTTNPTEARLVIKGTNSGSFDSTGIWSYYYSGNSGGGSAGEKMSIYAEHYVYCKESFLTASDGRTKVVEGRSDTADDLAALLGIEVTDYTYVDTVAKGTGKQKKVIAQQVETIYPQAITRNTDVVPDIYEKSVIEDGWVQLATDLKVGERVRLIGEKEEAIHEVLEVREGAFRTAFKPETSKIFVFGREVKDFRTVDYDAISMLNVSATQELARKLEASEAKLATLQAENAALKTELTQQAAKDQTIEARLALLEQSAPRTAATMPVNLRK